VLSAANVVSNAQRPNLDQAAIEEMCRRMERVLNLEKERESSQLTPFYGRTGEAL
jgi:hypothetical protein